MHVDTRFGVSDSLRNHATEVDRRQLKNQPSKPNNSPRHPNFAIGSVDKILIDLCPERDAGGVRGTNRRPRFLFSVSLAAVDMFRAGHARAENSEHFILDRLRQLWL